MKRLLSVHRTTRLVLPMALLLGASGYPGACGERYYVNSVYNVWTPNPWANMRKYRAFVDESKARGFNSINLDISWATARPDCSYDFSLFDRQVSYAISKGMYVWPRLNCSLIRGREPYWFTDEMCIARYQREYLQAYKRQDPIDNSSGGAAGDAVL